MLKLFSRITKRKEDYLLYEESVLTEAGRLSGEGRDLFVDLLFSGMTPEEARNKIVEEVKAIRQERKES
jgi:hypothetical protein